jgi:hypothetical protein
MILGGHAWGPPSGSDGRAHGSSTVNVEPSPGVLATRIEPPWLSTIRRAM